jgi:outer membrane protein assembly factor BamD
MNIIKSFLLVIISSVVLVACQSTKTDNNIVTPAQDLYNNGVMELESGNYKQASLEFEKVFFQHPGNSLTPVAELMQAYSLYLAGDYEDTSDVLEIFIKLHPRHEHIAYAYYLKAMSDYAQISSVKLDQSKTKNALESLQEVINRFPGTRYALDAALKIDLVNDHLAGKEMLVGRYYMNKNNPIAAIERFQTVIEKYDTTSHSAEALYRLVEANLMLGLNVEAKKYAHVLDYNYSDSNWNLYSKKLLK